MKIIHFESKNIFIVWVYNINVLNKRFKMYPGQILDDVSKCRQWVHFRPTFIKNQFGKFMRRTYHEYSLNNNPDIDMY